MLHGFVDFVWIPCGKPQHKKINQVLRLIYLISLNDNFQIACHVRQSQTQSHSPHYSWSYK